MSDEFELVSPMKEQELPVAPLEVPVVPTVTKIYFILDRSDSMKVCKKPTIDGFNSFLETQSQKVGGDQALFSLYQFNQNTTLCYSNMTGDQVPRLTEETFLPDGCTALYDAIGTTISAIIPQDHETIIVVILTDGQENSSRTYSAPKIKSLISEKSELGWEFVYLGANQDAILVSGALGISPGTAMTFTQDGPHTERCFKSLNELLTTHRTTKTDPVAQSAPPRLEFTAQDRHKCL